MAYDFVIAEVGAAASVAAMRLVRDFGYIAGNTNASAMAIGSRAAELIGGSSTRGEFQ